ncbi:hypothetical protein LEP1GSC185_2544 [Leptospira licerasiae serovar Varillal str. VAR 010]|uniref:Uncharacterized protein n=1 Tax=Leptospira licerasiae str. MMD4847 TaxID=1049971 RepID=A0ABN0H993_9LEPT|nr:hypothetical protein LEP1GSC185_2544 [Leptospira licerasiae serovar Varillal str. VAR 010]EJZ42064.1 hypothetical protein LEP1GSC178_0316 [Leptospira licerasiae str. MMD4847]
MTLYMVPSVGSFFPNIRSPNRESFGEIKIYSIFTNSAGSIGGS